MTVITNEAVVGLLPKKSAKSTSDDMKVLRVSFGSPKPVRAKASSKKQGKSMSFTEWVDHYVEMSKGNPV